MKERIISEFDSQIVECVQVKEVFPFGKNTALILELQNNGYSFEGHFRPESGIKFVVPQIPKPQELYRDVAYHRVDRLLGWGVSAPVTPFQLSQSEKGVIRPFWRTAQNMQVYHFTRENLLQEKDYWTQVAVLDYMCGVFDRGWNDILMIDKQKMIIDSGLSFVPGENFTCDLSLIRGILKGEAIYGPILADLDSLEQESLTREIGSFVGRKEIEWVTKRKKRLLDEGVVL